MYNDLYAENAMMEEIMRVGIVRDYLWDRIVAVKPGFYNNQKCEWLCFDDGSLILYRVF